MQGTAQRKIRLLAMASAKSNASDMSPHDRDTLRGVSESLENHFPQPTEETELVLMEISPHQLYAYWHITPWDLESAHLHNKDETSTLVLRFHDLTELDPQHPAPPAFDIEISQTSGSQYVEVWEDAKRYAAELGFRNRDGLLLDLARSNTVELPRAGYSPRSGSRILTLTPQAEALHAESPLDQTKPVASSTKNKLRWLENKNQPQDITLLSDKTDLYPVFPDPSLPLVEEKTKPTEYSAMAEPSDGEILSGTSMTHDPGIQVTPPNGKSTEDLTASSEPSLSAIEAPLVESFPCCPVEEIQALDTALNTSLKPPLSMTEAATQIPAGYSIPSVAQPKAPSPQMTMVTDQSTGNDIHPPVLQPLSSHNLGKTQHDEVHAELIIHGHSQPNSQFIFYGHAIPTLADGSFTLQRKLPASTLKLVAQLLATNHEK